MVLSGEGVNQAVAAARLVGARVAMIGCVGRDAFAGALGVALAEGQPLNEAVRWGNAAAALAASGPGAQPSLPTCVQMETLLDT
jgi:sugar/nucleoside kinase (ribokinase family)